MADTQNRSSGSTWEGTSIKRAFTTEGKLDGSPRWWAGRHRRDFDSRQHKPGTATMTVVNVPGRPGRDRQPSPTSKLDPEGLTLLAA